MIDAIIIISLINYITVCTICFYMFIVNTSRAVAGHVFQIRPANFLTVWILRVLTRSLWVLSALDSSHNTDMHVIISIPVSDLCPLLLVHSVCVLNNIV